MQNIMVTPKGSLVYPHLTNPDTKFDKDGLYKTQLLIKDEDAAQELVDELTEMFEAYVMTQPANKRNKKAKMPFQKSEDGGWIFTFKCRAKGIRQDGTTWSQKPLIVDAKRQPFSGSSIWGGSEAKVSFTPFMYNVAAVGLGITLRLKAAQILNLVEGGDSAQSYGFSEEEGFDGGSTPTAQAEEVPSTTEESSQEETVAANY